jgi:hypothetical protein
MRKPAADLYAVSTEPRGRGGRSRGRISVVMEDNRVMTASAARPGGLGIRGVLRAPFTRSAWVDLGYAILNVPVAIAGFVVLATTSWHPMLLFVTTPVARGLGTANRSAS